MTMSPDDHYEENFKTAELNLLKQKIISLDPEKADCIYLDGQKLEEAQKAVPNVDVLPCLKLSDVQEAPKLPPIEVFKIAEVPTQVCNVHTNDITYLKLFFDCNGLRPDDVQLIPLFCAVINEMGTEKYDYREFDKIVMSKTGGFDFRLHLAENIYDSSSYDVGLLMGTHVLNKNTADMFELCNELLQRFRFTDTERLAMLLDNYMSNMSVGIANSGHLYAMQSCAGLVTSSGKLKSQLSGVEHIEYMKSYVKNTNIETIRKSLTKLGGKMFNKKNMRVAVNLQKDFHNQYMAHYEKFLKDFPETTPRRQDHKVNLLKPSCQHYIMNVPVNYVAKAFLTVPYTHKDHPTLRVLAKLLSAKYLLPVVREQNGAYGAGAKLSSEGMFSFFSYRDPNSLKTLGVFDQTYEWLHQQLAQPQKQTIFEAKLGVLQQLDAPVAPGNIGIDYFLYGVTQEMFLKYRNRMLYVTQSMLQKAVETYFKDTPKNYGKVILGPENKDVAEQKTEQWKIIT